MLLNNINNMADLTGSFIPTEHYAELNIPQPIRDIQSRRDLSEEFQDRYDRFKDMKTEPRFKGFGDVVTEDDKKAEGGSGTGTTGGSSTGGHTSDSVINTINGGSQPLSIDREGARVVTIMGNKLSAVPPTSTDRLINISDFKVNATATVATFTIEVDDDYKAGSVSYMGKIIANVIKAGSGEDF